MIEEKIEIGWSDFLGNPIRKHIDWLPFEEAREFARSLNLKNSKEWKPYHFKNRPNNIPSTPHNVYKDKGWKGWGDFLGTGNIYKGEWIPFEEAREFARSLNFRSQVDWISHCRDNNLEGIPSNPRIAYKDKGWSGWGDFLGTGNKSTYEWKSFDEAREFARNLDLKSSEEWFSHIRENKPEGIPAVADRVYKDKGWSGWGDFLGTGNIHKGDWLPFEETRELARSLNLKSTREWYIYHKENRPEGIPQSPHTAYRDKGWINWGDFLYSGNKKVDWLPFEEARAFARSLNLKKGKEWFAYHKENKPEGMPCNPDKFYKDKGWTNWGDFLGTGNIGKGDWLPFEEVRSFARSLNLKSGREWRSYYRENRPDGMPCNPNEAYKDKGWNGMRDFLGTVNKSANEWKSFEEAREFARSLNLKNQKEWFAYHKENKPEGIPSAVSRTYKDEGWKGMGDFLGFVRTWEFNWLPFEEAREFARSLNLKNQEEWWLYHRENKPEGMPFNPSRTYKDKGWKGMGDFLGTRPQRGRWKSFEEARDFARSLNLKSGKEWFAYHGENRPEGIPCKPNQTYKGKGWVDWYDFLGN